MHYTLKQLQVFLAVANHENASKAADELAMSQSAVSTALKELEQRFDLKLFDRVGKRLQLNEQGALMRAKAASLLAQAQELELSLRKHSDIGELKVGATLTIGNYLAVEIMAGFMKEHDQAKVELVVENTASIAAKVQNFELDIGLIEGELQQANLDVRPWRDDELALFCSPEHYLAKKQNLDDLDLMAANWIVRETGSGTRQAFDRAMSGILSGLKLRLELQHTEGSRAWHWLPFKDNIGRRFQARDTDSPHGETQGLDSQVLLYFTSTEVSKQRCAQLDGTLPECIAVTV